MSTHYLPLQVNPIQPVQVNLRQAQGTMFNMDVWFYDLNNAPMTGIANQHPQAVFRPRSKREAHGYDIDIVDAATAHGFLQIEGYFFNDRNGYGMEIYTRNDDFQPIDMVAKGRVYLDAGGYRYDGPLGPLSLPVIPGPQGPPGPVGAASVVPGPQGIRGAMWFNGHGDPTLTSPQVQSGDQYLDMDNGAVWMFDAEAGWLRS